MNNNYKSCLVLFFFLTTLTQFCSGQIINIPDLSFKNTLTSWDCVDTDGDGNPDSNADLNDDGEIQVSEAEAVTSLILIGGIPSSIDSFEGLEFFVNLETFSFNISGVDALDLSALVNLRFLRIGSSVDDLDLSQNTLLEELIFDYPSFYGVLDLSNNPNLDRLTARFAGVSNVAFHPQANLSKIDLANLSSNSIPNPLSVSQHTNLVELDLSVSNYDSLDLSNNPNLEVLRLSGNDFTVIDLTNNPNLRELNLSSNDLMNIDLSQNTNLEEVNLELNDLLGIDLTQNVNLLDIDLRGNQITEIDVTQNPLLEVLDISNLGTAGDINIISEIDLTNNINLKELNLRNNNLDVIDLQNNVELEELNVFGNNLLVLDVSNNTSLVSLDARSNQLVTLNIKNGIAIVVQPQNPDFFTFAGNPDLAFVCADEDELSYIQSLLNNYNNLNTNLNTYCSFVPGGEFFTIAGNARFDFDNNGCDNNDFNLPFFQVSVSEGNEEIIYFGDSSGYTIPLSEGTFDFTPVLDNPDYFNVSPPTVTVDFPTNNDPFIQNYCISAVGVQNDLEITLIPIGLGVPGFNSEYKIIYKNTGNTVLSGTINFEYDPDFSQFIEAAPAVSSQTTNLLEWDYVDLLPFESRSINCTLNLNAPTDTPPLNSGDVLVFTAFSQPQVSEGNPLFVSFVLVQELVNSFDPNDKRCLNGETVTPEFIGEDVTYMIRFENNGTANAQNVVIRDIIDTSKFDISSLVPIDASHEFFITIRNDNQVEFIFENIQLPFDDENNDGYIVFKIKTLPTLEVGDIFDNDAEIFFDFNFPIVTNNFETEIVEEDLSVSEFDRLSFNVFPNPTNSNLTVSGNTPIKELSIHDINGRLLKTIFDVEAQNDFTVDVNGLAPGLYLLNITSGNRIQTLKFIKN